MKKNKYYRYQHVKTIVALIAPKQWGESDFMESYESMIAGEVSEIAKQYLSGEISFTQYLQLEEKIYGNINIAA